MLVDFKVSNFSSFDEEQLFSMEAGKGRTHFDRVYNNGNLKLLRFMAIYGANASGKSNLVEAFAFARETIIDGLPSNCSNCYCRVAEENKTKPSIFEFTIEIEGKKYTYGFETILSAGTFTKEWLKEYCYSNVYKDIFYRNIIEKTFSVTSYFKDPAINDRLSIYAEDITADDSVLFLQLMNKNKDSLYSSVSELKIYKTIFNWFKYRLSVNSPNSAITNYSYLLDEDSIKQISDLLNKFGTGISEFKVADVPIEKVISVVSKGAMQEISEALSDQKKYFKEKNISKNPAILLRNPVDNSMFIVELSDNDELRATTLQFNHINTTAIFSLNEESDGTIRLLDLIEVLITDSSEKVYIIDEINRKFHPLLTEEFIKEYFKIINERKLQLIVTTHESRIMNLDLLRKDEIAFVNKDDSGRSTFFSLKTFPDRNDKKIITSYLHGDYSAIPIFKESK